MKKNITYEEVKKLIDSGNLTRAIYFLGKYIKENPDDECSKGIYVSLLLLDNKIEEAETCLNSILNTKYDKSYHIYRIAFLKNDYKRAYELLPMAEKAAYKFGYDMVFFEAERLFLQNRLGILIKPKYFDKLGYLKKQIISYDDERAIDHIEHHKNIDEKEEHEDIFEKEIDIKSLFYLVKKSLESAKLFNFETDKLSKICYFEYPDVSNIILRKGYQFKYLKVVVFRDTNEIITIYPFSTKEKIQDINYLEKEEDKVLTKRPSQIEKFNGKYNR